MRLANARRPAVLRGRSSGGMGSATGDLTKRERERERVFGFTTLYVSFLRKQFCFYDFGFASLTASVILFFFIG